MKFIATFVALIGATCALKVDQKSSSTATQPSREDQINGFANGFFNHCNLNKDEYLTKPELKQCLDGMLNGRKHYMEEQIKKEKEKKMAEFNW